MARIPGTLREDQYTCLIIFCSVLLRMRNVSYKNYRENQNTHFVWFFLIENRAVCEIKCKNIVQPDRTQTAVRLIHIAY